MLSILEIKLYNNWEIVWMKTRSYWKDIEYWIEILSLCVRFDFVEQIDL